MPTVGIIRTAAWHVQAVVPLTRLVRYDVRMRVNVSRDIRYDVKSILAVAGLIRIASWHMRGVAGLTRQATWQVGGAKGTDSEVFVPRPTAFDRVLVDFMALGGARVTWTLAPHFLEPTPHTFQLQTGLTGLDTSDDWVDVGPPVVDMFLQTDAVRRWYGKSQTPHYRVKLTANGKVYYSNPADVLGLLGWKDWHLAQEVVRKEKLRHKWFTSVDGFLLKQKRGGAPCPLCLDPYTGESRNSRCLSCFGTRWLGGYFKALPLTYADVGQEQSKEHRELQAQGMVKELMISGRFIGAPQLYAQDIWVNGTTDGRYNVGGYKIEAQFRGVPVVVTAELQLLPPDDVAYKIPLN